MGIVVQIEQDFEASDRGLAICGLELLVDGGSEQKRTHGIHQFAAPELVRMAGCHADHVEERGEKAAAHQSVMCRRLIEVECAGDRHDGFEMRRSFNGSLHLRSGEITDADHADIAVRPWLLRSPLNEVVHVAAFLTVKKAEGATGTTGASTVRDNVDIATRNEEVAGAGFDESGWRAEILNLPRIRRRGNQHGISTGFVRAMHVRHQA